MGILGDLEKIGKDIEHDVENIGAEIDKEFQKAAHAVTAGLAKAEALLEKGIDDIERAIIRKVVDEARQEYAGTIGQLRALGSQTIASADPQAIRDDIIAAFREASNADAEAILSNLKTQPMLDSFAAFVEEFRTITLYAAGEVDLGIGLAAAAGGGVRMPDADEARMLVDFEVSGGAEEGADVGVSVGLWRESPKDLQGGFIAVTLGADELVGADVILYLSLELRPKFIGVVIDLTAGEELEFSIDCGFTLAFKVPAADKVPA